MRRTTALLAAAAMVLLIGSAPASANNDPHRDFFPSGPLDLDETFCAFPVHIEILVNREYGKTSEAADGSTVIHVTGRLVVEVANVDTGASITVNAGGPGTLMYSPDGTTLIFHFLGRSLVYSPNLSEFGYPSNVMAFAGPFGVTMDLTDPTGALLSAFGHPAVITDVCAALS